MKDIPFDIVFTSPLKRAKETAQLVLGGRDVPVVEDGRIAEISFGKYEGTHWDPKAGCFESPAIFNFFNHPENMCRLQTGNLCSSSRSARLIS